MDALSLRENLVSVAGKQYRRASWGRRIGSRVIDIFLVVMLGAFTNDSIEPFVIIGAIIYLLFGEWLLKGRGIGKRMLGIKTIDAKHGEGPGPIQDLIRHRYLFFANPLFLILTAYDTQQGCFESPETYVVMKEPLSDEDLEELKEKPAKLDLVGMREGFTRQ